MAQPKNPWKQRFTFLTPKGVQHVVCGRSLTFYPLSVDMLARLRHFAEPLAEAVVTLMAPSRQDSGSQIESIEDKKESVNTKRTIMESISPELAKHRDGQRNDAVKKLVDAFLDEQSRIIFGEIVCDSLRDDFTRAEARDPRTVEEFLDGDAERPGIDARMMVEFLVGVFNANKEVFGPLGLDAARESIAKRLSELGGGDEKSKTDNSGENSQTALNSPSPVATT